MARTEGKQVTVEGDEEIQRRKRVNNDKDAHPAKKAKVEGNKAAEALIRVSRNLGNKAEGETAAHCNGELNKLGTSTGNKTKEEEEFVLTDDEINKLQTHTDGNVESGDEVNRLRGLLADCPKKLSNKDVEDVICSLEVDEIVSLALKSVQREGRDDGDTEEDDEWIEEDYPYVSNHRKALGVLRLMLRRVENVKETGFCLLYKNLPHPAFALLLLVALDSYSNRCCGGVPLLKVEDRDMIPELCRVLPWKLLAHILYYKTSLPLLKYTSKETSEESNEECTPVQKKAAESCSICFGKAKHRGLYGYYCSFLDSVPIGATVGPNYRVVCKYCRSHPSECYCGSEVGQAMPNVNPKELFSAFYKKKSGWKI